MSNAGLRSSLSDRDIMLVNTEFERRKKSRVIAFILWFFLGVLGIHRFYTGQIGYGVCILLFGWLTFGIWPFIDGLVLLISSIDKINDEIEKEIIYSVK